MTVSKITGRRELKKAQTRELVRTVAQRMFAERGFDAVTIADIAREADVAVQTVFNHFPTKEELFFEGRLPDLDGPAAAVRNRQPGVPPLTALREFLVATISQVTAVHGTPELRNLVATMEAAPSLLAKERDITHLAEERLRDALHAAWVEAPDADDTPADPATAAALTAAVWVSAARTLIVGHRSALTSDADPESAPADATALADRLYGQLQAGLVLVHGEGATARRSDTGWPLGDLRRAG